MKILIINGPNLNLLGKRDQEIYGSIAFEDHLEELKKTFTEHEIHYFQSNIEGEIVDELQKADKNKDAVILNPAAYSHTSIAIADAVSAINTNIPVIEVHISNIHAREGYRKKSITAEKCNGMICGLGLESYRTALRHLLERNN
ncbi:MAG: type II 3-dehydroquinate dehydratase [Flavobacteriales bacterium]